jgi:hypothetical protein
MPQAEGSTVRIVWGSVVGLIVLLPGVVPAQAPKKADPFEEPLKLIAGARAAYAKIKDYSCTLIKRERIDGVLSPNHVVTLRVRKEPFSVSMLWQEPKDSEGQEVVYVAGKYDGKMRVKASGLLGALGFLTLATDDPRTRKESKHKVSEAGIGNLLEQFGKGWEAEQKWKQTQVRIGTFTFAKRKCTRVELTHPSPANGRFKHHRNVVYFDQQTSLPIRVENYNWPDKPGDRPSLAEVFSYVNLHLNPNLPDSVFER